MITSYRIKASHRSGAALIITLAFIVLLTALLLVYITQAVNYRLLSTGSYNDFKSGAIGQSALEAVTGDLIQEIVNGSTNSTTITNTFTYANGTNMVYYPTTNIWVVPQRSNRTFVNGTTDPFPNLIRWSTRSDSTNTSLYPAVASRASAVSSTNAALYGQYISTDRWNKHYLIPRATYGATTISTTPTNTFIAPDWVYVTSQGPTVLTAVANTVVGRYAYAVYDEGGLLDVNVAGYPDQGTGTPMPVNATHPATAPAALPMWGAGLKGSEAFADLTQIGLTQAQVDQIVGWRNNFSAGPSGNFSSGYTFSSTSALLYHDNVATNATGFLTNFVPSTAPTTFTDQTFISRQALIQFFVTEGFPQDSLQYLATFTRDVDQPSYNPPTGRPMVQSGTASTANNITTFGTGNDAYGTDRYGTTGQPTGNTSILPIASQDINPPLLSVRVATSFQRPDGTTAQVGEALLKKRFPLSRLSLITSTAIATQSQSDPIYRNFGLYRSSASSPWMYNHDSSIVGIDRLTQVGDGSTSTYNPPREPDFFELLKAAINVGSIGKGACYSGWPSGGTEGTLQQARDNLTALQILQIGANIIDQAKADNFPTRIQFSGDTTVPPNEVRGSEDLPYLYRYRNWVTRYSTSGSLGAYLLQPELWDPYSPGSSALVAATATPTTFRVRAECDPSLAQPASPITFGVAYQSAQTTFQDNSGTVTFNNPNSNANTSSSPYPTPVTFNAGERNNYWGFREPTLLGQIGMPSTSHLTGDVYTDVVLTSPNNKITGLLVDIFPWINPTGAPTDVAYYPMPQANGNTCIRFYLDYQDSSSNWIPYDEQIFEVQGATKMDVHTSFSWTAYATAVASADYLGAARTDPRTSRWGYFYGQYMYSLPSVDTSNNEYGSYRSDGGISFGTHQGGRADKGFIGSGGYGKQYRGFEHDYWAENSTRVTYQNTALDTGDNKLRYNLDPDGIPRRTMGGYVTDTSNGGAAPSATPSLTGLPTAIGSGTVNNTYAGQMTPADPNNPAYASRPTILHRPFRSVAELGYVFRDTPWGNINFTFPESGDSALLDVFCINETSDPNGLVAGRVNLNTHQAPVIQALLSNTLRDKDDPNNPVLSSTMASDLGKQLVARTSNPTSLAYYGPLANRANLVGTWIGATTPATAKTAVTSFLALLPSSTATLDNNLFTGFSYDIGTSAVPSVNSAPAVALIPRQRNAVMRALVDSGTTRTWNLLIDLVAQSGHFPPNTTNLANFVVEGEKHYWLHVAIDRYTGKILDSQLEVVRE